MTETFAHLKTAQKPYRVVVVGAGFAGLNVAKRLGGQANVAVTLIDRRNYHLFQPLLYQVATAGLSPAEIAAPIRAIVSEHSNVNVLMGNVASIDLPSRSVRTEDSLFEYDFLVLACGAKHSYFGHEEWESFAPGLKTLEQATEIRRRILLAYELAERETDAEKQKALLTFVIVGGGPTGVELAGAIAEISRFTLDRDFRRIDPSRARVILIEAGPRVLATFSEKLSKRAARDLEKLGVQVWTQTRVTEVSEKGVALKDEFVRAHTVIWAAGVQPSSLGQGLPHDAQGRVIVAEDLSLKAAAAPEVFVIGDMACAKTEKGETLPGLAPVAMQQGRYVGAAILKCVRAFSAGKPLEPIEPFRYFDKGAMATIGRKRAILQWGPIQLGGFFAWASWLFVHVYYLIGFKNRLFVLMQWTWSYVTFQRGARLIVDKEWKTRPRSK